MSAKPLAITGATGGIGGRVARRLAAAGVAQRLIVRDAQRAPALDSADLAVASFDDPAAVRDALSGVDAMLFVSAGEHPDRIGLHRGVVDAAIAGGVRRIVYVSFLRAAADATFTFARDHFFTEEHIRATGVEFTFLRNSLYADFVPMMCGDDGVIRGPAGDGVVGLVTRDDIAEVAASVLTADGHDGQTYDVTGPQLLSLVDVADILTRCTGREIAYQQETMEEAYASRASYGAPRWEVDGWVTTYAAIAAGDLAVLSDTVKDVAGHPPQSLEQHLQAHPEQYAHLTPR